MSRPTARGLGRAALALALVAAGYGAREVAAPAAPAAASLPPGVEPFAPRGFVVRKQVRVPCTPEEAYDAYTGDLSPWWDHHFSAEPTRFVIEPRPGGRMLELVDERGDGVVHAEVTWAVRGARLVFRGPLGAHGRAVDMVHDLRFRADGEETVVALEVHCLGEFDDANVAAIDRVWDHFLGDRFVDYVASGRFRAKVGARGR